MRSCKGVYPWRLGATSYVIPGDILANVKVLADKVDDVQLLFFESGGNSRLTHEVDMKGLAQVAQQNDLTYTAHLPSDLQLGSENPDKRQEGIDEIVRLINELETLQIKSFDLHLEQNQEIATPHWLDCLSQSLTILKNELGDTTDSVCIENIDYPFSLIESLIEEHGFSRCLDVGHVLHFKQDWSDAIKHIYKARHIHYHGVQAGKDHRAITSFQEKYSHELGAALAESGYNGVVTLEMYDLDKLGTSLISLAEAWSIFVDTI